MSLYFFCRNLNQRWIDCEQKAQSRLQMLDNTLKELSEYKRQLEEMRMWLTEHKVKLSDPVPMTLSVDELNSARQKHSVSCCSIFLLELLYCLYMPRLSQPRGKYDKFLLRDTRHIYNFSSH